MPAPENVRLAKRSASRKRPAGTSPPRVWLWRSVKIVALATLLLVLFIAGYLIYLDRKITDTFEGRRWSVPAQIYAQPMELYPGAPISARQLTRELKRLGYQAHANLPHPGTYRERGRVLQVYLRGFRFMERTRDPMRAAIEFDTHQILSITDSSGTRVPLLRLDPAVIGSFFPSHGEDRIVLAPEQVPPLLADGLKAIEDREFDKHIGFSLRGILRALVVNLQAGETRQGGSTLTQQLVKSYYLTNRQTLERKLQEVAMAVILDARFAKDDILTAYINEIFLGQNGNRAIHGFGLGAQFYFNKPLPELEAHEIATLIAIIRGPSYYNPFRHPQRAMQRRDRILQTLENDGLLSAELARQARSQPLGVVASPTSGGAYYPAFMDQVRAELSSSYDQESLNSQGLRVFTTLQPHFQEVAQRAVSTTLTQIENDRQLPPASLQAAALVAETQTGEIMALVGGRKGRVDGFNRALNAQRPIGSLIKPLIYLTAIEQGRDLTDVVADEPIVIEPQHGEPWAPKNFDGEAHGPVPLLRALAQSMNLATVHLGMEVGLASVQQRFRDLTLHPPSNPYPSLLLGAESLAPIRVLELYGNFASGGFRTQPKAVVAVLDEQGRPLSHHPFDLAQTIDASHAATINRALEIVMARGTGRASPYARHGVAGKTGTSNDHRDSWFAAFDNRYLTVIWVGRDDNAQTGLTGSSGAMRVWNTLVASIGIDPLVHPPDERLVAVDFESGMLAEANCADVVMVPVRDPAQVDIKPGCNVRRSMGDRVRRWLR